MSKNTDKIPEGYTREEWYGLSRNSQVSLMELRARGISPRLDLIELVTAATKALQEFGNMPVLVDDAMSEGSLLSRAGKAKVIQCDLHPNVNYWGRSYRPSASPKSTHKVRAFIIKDSE